MYSRLYLVMCPPIASRGALLVLFSGFDFSQTLLGRIGFLHGYGAIYHDFHHTHNVGNFGGEGANHLLHQQHKSGFFDLHSFLSHTHTHSLSLSLCVFLLSFPSFLLSFFCWFCCVLWLLGLRMSRAWQCILGSCMRHTRRVSQAHAKAQHPKLSHPFSLLILLLP